MLRLTDPDHPCGGIAMTRRLLVVAVLGLLVGADASPEAIKKEQQKLKGTWKVVAVVANGDSLPDEVVKEIQLVITGDKITVKGDFPDKEKYSNLKFKVDPAANPKKIDFTLTDSGNEQLKGIYQLNGDEWKFCATLGGQDRPTAFESKADSDHVLATLKRDKP
jgi:uncharacterized protein (TIGR03067 family)